MKNWRFFFDSPFFRSYNCSWRAFHTFLPRVSCMKHLKNTKGFTLIEIISVILVMGIIGAVAAPMFDTSTIDVSVAGDTARGDIQYVQELAMMPEPAPVASLTPKSQPQRLSHPKSTQCHFRHHRNQIFLKAVIIISIRLFFISSHEIGKRL